MQFGFLKAGLIFSFLFLLGCGTHPQGNALQPATAQTATRNLSSITRSITDLSKFAGTWNSHGSVLVISSDGSATFEQRTYRWCGSGVAQPCDTIDAQGNIQDGNHEQLQFSRISGSVAYGTVTSSNFHTPGLAISVTLQPNDTLLYAGNSPISLLCGPNAPVGTCGA